MLKPKLFTTLKEYSFRQFRADVVSGLIVGIVALPLAIAFAIASGVSPDRGLVTAVIAGFLISVLGGSRVQIGGPTGAFVVIVYGIVQKFGMDGLLVATFMGGILLVTMGFARLGGVIKFIPYPLTVGFTSGIALIILSSQVKDFLGLPVDEVPADFIEKSKIFMLHMHEVNTYALFIGLGTVVLIAGWRHVTKKIPGSLVALVLATVLVQIFHLPVETIGSRFGEIPHTLPSPNLPHVSWPMIQALIPSAFIIAVLAGIESLLSAMVADGMVGGSHRSNMELLAQGIANMGSALFGGMPAAGAIARTVTNIQNGGRTPVAGIIHALALLVIMFFLGKWIALVPLACLAGILVMVAYHMSEWRSFAMILRAPRGDIAVLLTTFFLTVAVDLTVAIEIGMVLAAFLLMHRLSTTVNIDVITREFADEEDREDPQAIAKRVIPEGVEVFEIRGPFFFGMTSAFLEAAKITAKRKPRVRILRMRHALTVDATALNALRQVIRDSEKNSIAIILSGVHAQPLKALEKLGLKNEIGAENIVKNIDAALRRAKVLLTSAENRV